MRRQLLAKLSGNKRSWATKKKRSTMRVFWLPYAYSGSVFGSMGFVIWLSILVLITPYSVLASSISEGFPGSGNYPSGTLVSVRNTEPTTVELANLNNNQYLLGVVVPEGGSLLTVKDDNSQVYVATSGDVEAYVSDINGTIEKGDFIGASWISGVGMKADVNVEQKLLGIALQSFSDVEDNAATFNNIETPSGKKSAKIGKIIIRLFDREVGPSLGSSTSALENLAKKIAGKEVDFARVFVAVGLFVVSLIISGVFLANAIRGSFISLGRNPLASSSIFASLMQVSGVSISLILIGSLISYLVLIL